MDQKLLLLHIIILFLFYFWRMVALLLMSVQVVELHKTVESLFEEEEVLLNLHMNVIQVRNSGLFFSPPSSFFFANPRSVGTRCEGNLISGNSPSPICVERNEKTKTMLIECPLIVTKLN
jgi:hypothetical protein